MRVQVAGRHMDVGDALRTRITDELSAGVEKYFSRATDAFVTVSKNGVGFEVDCDLHLFSGISLQAQGHGADAHAAFGQALHKIEKRIKRVKGRLKNHHTNGKSPLPAEDASAYVLAPFEDEDEVGGAPLANGANHVEQAPLVIAETKTSVKTMTVSMAVLQLDLAESPALMFRNAANGRL
ncbi:MAG: ribosome-associated translation inhibitor RaiA, partial [Caulobacterales bacterium]